MPFRPDLGKYKPSLLEISILLTVSLLSISGLVALALYWMGYYG